MAGELATPFPYRVLLYVAALLLPRRSRAAWRRDWLAEIGHLWRLTGGRPDPGTRLLLGRRVLGAFRDAWWVQREEFDGGWFQHLRNAWAAVGEHPLISVAAALFLVFAPWTYGSSALAVHRRFLQPLPYSEPARLMILHHEAVFLSNRLPLSAFYHWRTKSQAFEDLAAFRWARMRAESGDAVRAGLVSTNLFDLLGVRPAHGRLLVESDELGPGEQPVVLGQAFWRSAFAADPSAVGQVIDLDGRPSRVVGVLPAQFWFVSPAVDVWLPLPRASGGREYWLPSINVVGRLKPWVRPAQGRSEMRSIVVRVRSHWVGPRVEVVPLGVMVRQPIYMAFVAPLAGLLIVLGVSAWRCVRGRLPASFRFWALASAETTLAFSAPAAVFAALADRSRDLGLVGGRANVGDWIALWAYLVACGIVVLPVSRDLRTRCPVCFARLRMPVELGTRSSTILELPGTEYMCPSGHGALYVPCDSPSGAEPPRWVAMDESWRELFNDRQRS